MLNDIFLLRSQDGGPSGCVKHGKEGSGRVNGRLHPDDKLASRFPADFQSFFFMEALRRKDGLKPQAVGETAKPMAGSDNVLWGTPETRGGTPAKDLRAEGSAIGLGAKKEKGRAAVLQGEKSGRDGLKMGVVPGKGQGGKTGRMVEPGQGAKGELASWSTSGKGSDRVDEKAESPVRVKAPKAEGGMPGIMKEACGYAPKQEGQNQKPGKKADGSEIKIRHEALALRFAHTAMEKGAPKEGRVGGSEGEKMEEGTQAKKKPGLHAGRGEQAKGASYRIQLGGQESESLFVKPREEREIPGPISKTGVMAGDGVRDRAATKSEAGLPDTGQATAGHGSHSSKRAFQTSASAGAQTTARSFKEKGIRQIVEKASLNWRSGKQEFSMELKPESLGRLKVVISTEDHQVKVKVVAQTQSAKELIEGSLTQLKASFQSQGLKVDLFDVSVGQESRHEATAFDPGPSHKRTGSGLHPSWQGRGKGIEDDGPDQWVGGGTPQGWDERAVNFFA